MNKRACGAGVKWVSLSQYQLHTSMPASVSNTGSWPGASSQPHSPTIHHKVSRQPDDTLYGSINKKLPLLLTALRGTTNLGGGVTLMILTENIFWTHNYLEKLKILVYSSTPRAPPPHVKMTAVFVNIFHLEFIILSLPSPTKILNMKPHRLSQIPWSAPATTTANTEYR